MGLLFFLLGAVGMGAQPRWEGGVWFGGSGYLGDLNPFVYPVPAETQPVFGAMARVQRNAQWGFRGQALYGRFQGSDQNSAAESSLRKRGFEFTTQFGELSVSAEWTPWLPGPRSERAPRQHRFWMPVFRLGGGAFWLNPQAQINGSEDVSPPAAWRLDQERRKGQILPGMSSGVSWKTRLSRTVFLGFDLTAHYQRTDYLDGISQAANPRANDWLFTSGFSLSIRPKLRDTDGDGIPDKEDACPRLPGDASARGCPDRDGDGVEDAEDACPDVPGLPEFAGCPDTDGDGIMDKEDLCPEEFGYAETQGCPDRDFDCVMDSLDRCPDAPGLPEFNGCPDTDGDGIPDPDDLCPEAPGPAEYDGCPDTDEDGVPDHLDACPAEPGEAAYDGCPPPDTDGDGIPDREDLCPHTPGPPEFKGCPDSDGDGIPDPEDCCPNEPGIEALQGCPELKTEEKKLLEKAMREVRFQTGNANLLPASLKVLDQIVALVEKYPAFSLEIRGHTDSQGKAAFNMALSKKRAKACYDYLAAKGVPTERMQWEGFGPTKPLRENSTPQGRAVNRRVEFELFLLREQLD